MRRGEGSPAGLSGCRLLGVLPAVAHGCQLAICWLLGAFAASAFEKGAYTDGWQEALRRWTFFNGVKEFLLEKLRNATAAHGGAALGMVGFPRRAADASERGAPRDELA